MLPYVFRFPLNCLEMSIKVAVVEDEKHYNNALKRRTTNDEMRFSLPNYFYFVGLASIIIQMPCSGEICEKIAESEQFLVHAFRIAPHMVERDVLLASLYMYLKRKEVH